MRNTLYFGNIMISLASESSKRIAIMTNEENSGEGDRY